MKLSPWMRNFSLLVTSNRFLAGYFQAGLWITFVGIWCYGWMFAIFENPLDGIIAVAMALIAWHCACEARHYRRMAEKDDSK